MRGMSTPDIPFNREKPTQAGEVARLAPLVRRVLAGNAGPFTFTGTCTYIVGNRDRIVIDPGPDDAAHRDLTFKSIGSDQIGRAHV